MELHSERLKAKCSTFKLYSLILLVLSWNVTKLVLCTKQRESVQRGCGEEIEEAITFDFEYILYAGKQTNKQKKKLIIAKWQLYRLALCYPFNS